MSAKKSTDIALLAQIVAGFIASTVLAESVLWVRQRINSVVQELTISADSQRRIADAMERL